MLPLDELQNGQAGQISKFDLNSVDSRKLMEMGLTIGSTVKVIKLAPLGDPIEILIRGYHLSLRKSEAHSIWVKPLPIPHE